MHCSACPADSRVTCNLFGCRGHALLRSLKAPVDGPSLQVSQPAAPAAGGATWLADLDLQVKRLDVESGDVLVVRTAKKLTAAQADAIDAQVSQLARRHGVRDVSVMVLDNATDLIVERPGAVDTRMQHQAPRLAPIVTR